MNTHLRSEKVDLAITLSPIKMRRLYLIRLGLALACMVFATAAFSDGFKSGPLGAVEIKPGQPIEIRTLLSDTVVPNVSTLIRTAIEIAIKDFGSIHGRQVFIETLDEMCSGEGGLAAAEAVVDDAQVVRRYRHLVFRCSGRGFARHQRGGPIDDIVGEHVICPNVRSVRKC